MSTRHWSRARRGAGVLALLVMTLPMMGVGADASHAATNYERISGAGSTWSQNAISQWSSSVLQNGIVVDYAGGGSSYGRQQFLNGTVDFAASDIPFQFHPEDGSQPEQPKAGSYAYMPVTAGGTVFMYNLTINGQRVTNLRLSGTNVAKIFTGVIKTWNDPAVVADNPGLALPSTTVVPVVRSDGSGSTAQLTLWMVNQHPDLWNAYCPKAGRTGATCGETSYYPTVSGMVAQAGDLGVAGYVAQNYANGAIGYVQYSYAKNAGFPVAKVLNTAGYYTEPTPQNVAVSLLKAQINTDTTSQDYLTQQLGDVYTDPDPRTYVLSSYSYLILPTTVQGRFNEKKGATLAAFSKYAMCEGQQSSAVLGYSPMPINLVQASFDQIKKIPGADIGNVSIQSCNNPTFSPDGTNKLADTAPQPQACDKQGQTQCVTATGGAKTSTPNTGSGGGAPAAGGSTAAGGTPAAGGSTPAVGGSTPAAGSSTAAAGSSTAASGLADTGAGAAAAANGTTASTQRCNADTGSCPASGASSGNAATLTGQATASPQMLPAKAGWSSTQTLMLLAGLLTVVLVLAPGLMSRALTKRKAQ